MNDLEKRVSAGWSRMGSMLVREGRSHDLPETGEFVNAPVSRGSTVLFPTLEAMNRTDGRSHAHKVVYGAMDHRSSTSLRKCSA